MPLMALTLDIQTATPLVAFVIVTNTLVITWGSWPHIDLRATWQLLLSSLVGIPVGLLILKTAPAGLVKTSLGILIILYSLYSLVRPSLIMIEQQRWAYFFGFLGGILGGAFNTNAPPLVIYGVLRRWPPERFRATLQGYFLLAGVLIWLGHGLAGLWTVWIVQIFGLALPLVLIAIFVGGKLNRHIPVNRFERLLYVALVGLGVLLLV